MNRLIITLLMISFSLLFGGWDLHDKIIKGNVVEIMEKINQASDAELNVADQYGNTPLMLATDQCQEKVVQALIDKKVNLDAQNKGLMSALHMAALVKCIPAANSLLAAGADVMQADKLHKTPLHYAADEKVPVITSMLLMHGANPNALDIFEMPPLHTAMSSHSYATMATLLEAGAERLVIEISRENYFFNPDRLIEKENINDFSRFYPLNHADAVATTNHGTPVITHAVLSDNKPLFDELMKKGADINALDAQGQPPLYYVCEGMSYDGREVKHDYVNLLWPNQAEVYSAIFTRFDGKLFFLMVNNGSCYLTGL